MMNASRWEMGSEFHLLMDFPHVTSNHQAFHGRLFVNGRASLRGIVDEMDLESPTCWIPSYVCSEVHDVLKPLTNINIYGDYPDEPAPRFESLKAKPGDIVLIQDTFGLGHTDQWHEWRNHNPDAVLIEDISHNNSQQRFLRSPADHVFSSLRKSLPVPDGGLVFSREGGVHRASLSSNKGSLLKLEAMILKALYLNGHSVDKQSFRTLQVQGEELLGKSSLGGGLAITQQMLEVFPHERMSSRWIRNSERLRKHLSDPAFLPVLEPLCPRGERQGPFHLVVKCSDGSMRNRLRNALIEQNIFPAVHWNQNPNNTSEKSVGLGETLLTLPTDFRYDMNEIDRLADILHTEITSKCS